MKSVLANAVAPQLVSQLRNYGKLMRLDKPIGIWLLLWPTLWALWLAGNGAPDQGLFVIFVLGVVVMRSAGCVLNDYADRNIDPYVERTRNRPQFVLGAAFGWGVPMAFAAQTGNTPELAWLVFGTAMIWAVIYDTFYAMVDREDDRKVGVKSTAILFGDADLFVIAGLQALMEGLRNL